MKKIKIKKIDEIYLPVKIKRYRQRNYLLLFMFFLLGLTISIFLFPFFKKTEAIKEPDFKVEIIQENPKVLAEVTAYSPSKDETDDSPFITASNRRVFDGLVANNCLPFGTKVKIGDRIYEVWDRMNKRYGCENFDIFFWTKKEALKWGRKKMWVEIIE
jgi:3D (Asp-Asp-Asp) domain-containing protein